MTLNPTAKIPPFITKVKEPVHFVSVEVLKKCRKGLKRHIKITDDPEKRLMLETIREEIGILITSL